MVTKKKAEQFGSGENEFENPPGYDALSELGRAEFECTGKMPETAAIPRSDFEREIEASQTAIVNAAIRHQQAYGVLPEAPAPYFQPNATAKQEADALLSGELATKEERAAVSLWQAKELLADIGHFETNRACVCIEEALAWLAKCEATNEP